MPGDEKAAGAGSTGGEKGDGSAGGANNAAEGSISKADHEKTVGELKQQIEEIRMEILTPEYLSFLEGGKKPAETVVKKTEETVDFNKMTPEQIYQKALADSEKRTKDEVEKVRGEFSSQSKASVQKEVAAFARVTPDYEKYRLLMYGVSLDPKNKDLSLPELYAKAKEHARGFGPTEDDKTKSRRASSERPGGSSSSVQKDKKYTPDSAAEEAWEETVGDKGFPKV